MGLKDKMVSLKNKATDALVNAKATYEKNCIELDCFSLSDIRKHKQLKGIVDLKKKTIEISGILDQECKDIKKPMFFMTPEANVFEIEEASIKQETIEIELKSKKDNYVITKAKLVEKVITLSKK